MKGLILSLFPNIGLLDRGFEQAGFCVVRGPDLIFGGDIKRFHPPANTFEFVIGGSPCQDFSAARRDAPTGSGIEMLREFGRVVLETQPRGALLENVPRVPHVEIEGYARKRIDLSDAVAGGETIRIRHFQYFYRAGDTWPRMQRRSVHVRRGQSRKYQPAVMASGGTSRNGAWHDVLKRQGLPDDFDLPPFKMVEKVRAVGNGVPFSMAKMIGAAFATMPDDPTLCPICQAKHMLNFCTWRECSCGCDRVIPISSGRFTATVACRKRLQRKRSGDDQITITIGGDHVAIEDASVNEGIREYPHANE